MKFTTSRPLFSAQSLALFTLLLPGVWGANITATCRQTNVAILGAGISGIITAQTLMNNSITDFVIVEYQDRIGGRVYHKPFGVGTDGRPLVVEMGANWIQGTGGPDQNPIYALETKWNITNVVQDGETLTYTEKGYVNYTDEIDEFSYYLGLINPVSGHDLVNNIPDLSVRDSLGIVGWNTEQRPDPQIARAAEWFGWDYQTAVPIELSSTIFNYANGNFTYTQYGPDDNLVIDQRGHDFYIRSEASTFLKANDTRLLLNTIVKRIEHNDSGVVVYNNDGSCIKANYAITTFALGVLQHADAVQFEPQLPYWKRRSIQQFETATYTKIFFQFPSIFWPKDVQQFVYADSTKRGHFPIWMSLDLEGYLPGSRVIFATVTGQEAYRIERLSDEEVQAEGLAVLRSMFPNVDVPEPTAILFPRWNQIPWAFGSYSAWPAGTTLRDHQNLRANVGNLWFTGEYASATHYGYMHGAYLEAQETALRVAGLIKGKCIGNQSLGQCGQRVHYDVLHGTSDYSQFTPVNGWVGSSFADE